jgi:hypothetical protein
MGIGECLRLKVRLGGGAVVTPSSLIEQKFNNLPYSMAIPRSKQE